jgi:hypothetical protein
VEKFYRITFQVIHFGETLPKKIKPKTIKRACCFGLLIFLWGEQDYCMILSWDNLAQNSKRKSVLVFFIYAALTKMNFRHAA